MSAAVLDLQLDITRGPKSITQLLREAKLIAAKLGLDSVENWIEHELKGYPSGVEVPKYREYHTQSLEVCNPYQGGWKFAGHVSQKRVTRQPITEIEGFSQVEMLYEPVKNKFTLSEPILQKLPQRLLFPGSEFKHMVEGVKEALLDWTIELEKRGIKGEGLSFNEAEKKSATEQVFNIQKFTGILGNVTNSNAQIYDFGSVYNLLKSRNVPKPERDLLEEMLHNLKESRPENRAKLTQEAKGWIAKNQNALGDAAKLVKEQLGIMDSD